MKRKRVGSGFPLLVAINSAVAAAASNPASSEALADYGFEALPIRFAHTELVRTLPLLYRDPFDRILVSQAIVEGLAIVINGIPSPYGMVIGKLALRGSSE